MSDEIKPALTPEEWTPTTKHEAWCGGDYSPDPTEVISVGDIQRWAHGTVTCHNEYKLERPHAAAALCLYGQPFGFTHEDVDALRNMIDEVKGEWNEGMEAHDNAVHCGSLAARIAALLPPENP